MHQKKQRGRPSQAKYQHAIERLASNFFHPSPLFRFMTRAGAGRKMMQAYRSLEGCRRPQQFRQDVW